jgi:hypothetical protein
MVTAMKSTAKVITARITGHGRPDALLTSAVDGRACNSPTSSTSPMAVPPQLPSCPRLEVRCASSASSTTILPLSEQLCRGTATPRFDRTDPDSVPTDDSNDAFDP